MNEFSLFQFDELSNISIIIVKPKSSKKRLSECGLNSVEHSHGFRDFIERQNTCSVIQNTETC